MSLPLGYVITVCGFIIIFISPMKMNDRGGSKTAATSKMELFVIIVNDWKSHTVIT